MKNIRLSLIITTYNSPAMLTRVLNGVLRQHHLPDEVIVADDGSGEETLRTVNQFKKKFPSPLHHVWQEDCGFRVAEIRNRAIKKASGDYLVFLDGDCIPAPHFIADHLRLAEAGCFFQGKRVLVNRSLSEKFTFSEIAILRKLILYWLKGQLENGHHLLRLPIIPSLYSKSTRGIRSCNTGLFKRDIESVNGYNQDFTGWGREDSELAVRLYNYGLKKKEHPFMAICFHLWHMQYDRNNLELNDKLLNRSIESDEYICTNGLRKISSNPL